MKKSNLFSTPLHTEMEESIRVDREIEPSDQIELLKDYHFTEETLKFFLDLLYRFLNLSSEMRRGWNYWLYGYFGSGKSHLLTILSLLFSSDWVKSNGKEKIYNVLKGQNSDSDIFVEFIEYWKDLMNNYYIQPLPINLLKYHGKEGLGFSEILLRSAHEQEQLSPHLNIAYFEKWFQQKEGWEQRIDRSKTILQRKGIFFEEEDLWYQVQHYPALTDIILPELFFEETGFYDGLEDLLPSNISPQLVVEELEGWRKKIEEKKRQPVRLLLLLDEISLFIGSQYEQLTELNALAEKIDEIGKGKIFNIITAQERIEDVQPEYIIRRADFSILKDRFPHRYPLPSRHVGEIVQRRLLQKTKIGEQNLHTFLHSASIQPDVSLLYTDVKQNTSPPLDQIDFQAMVDYFPLLPYHPALFMEILNNIRGKEQKRAKSIFSGTARAILALVKGLLEDWEKKEELELINLVDFYEIIKYELAEIIGDKVKTIEAIEEEIIRGDLQDLDGQVAKVVLLLQYIPDNIPLSEPENIAVSIMKDLNGLSRISMQNRVDESLKRLSKFLRKNEERRPYLRFTNQEEQRIYQKSMDNLNKDWISLFPIIDKKLSRDLFEKLNLPFTFPFLSGEEEYPLKFQLLIEDRPFEDSFGNTNGLSLSISIQNLIPSLIHQKGLKVDLYWIAADQGKTHALNQLKEWAALALSCSQYPSIPSSIVKDLERKKEDAIKKIVDVLEIGYFIVKGKKYSSLHKGLLNSLQAKYPSYFHPLMIEIGKKHLKELKTSYTKKMPSWALTLQIPTRDPKTHQGDIYQKIRSITGRSLKKHKELSLNRIMEIIESEETLYQGVRPAIASMLFGLCEKGDFIPYNPKGNPLPVTHILSVEQWDDIFLRIAPKTENLLKLMQTHLSFITTHDTLNSAFVKISDYLYKTEESIGDLKQQIEAERIYLLTTQIKNALSSFLIEIQKKLELAQSLVKELDKQTKRDWKSYLIEVDQIGVWICGVKELWNYRKKYMFQLDIILALKDKDLPWISRNARDALDKLTFNIKEAIDTTWWTNDGWQTFSKSIRQQDTIAVLLKEWNLFCQLGDRESLYKSISKNPWLNDPMEVPGEKIHSGFQREILTPLREFKNAYKRAATIMDTIDKDLTQLEERDFFTIRKSLTDFSYEVFESSKVNELLALWKKMDSTIGEKSFEEVLGIGLWKDDEKILYGRLKEYVKSKQYTDIRFVEGGVIIE